MTDKIINHPFAAEAANPDTVSERLIALSQDRSLLPLIAANPATPPETLELLGKEQSTAIRHALAQNPNTPVPILLRLIQEFPGEFLANPILPLLNLSQPDFIKRIPQLAWLHLLRYENIPITWPRLLQQGFIRLYGSPQQEIMEAVHAHILIAGEATEVTNLSTPPLIEQYKQQASKNTGIHINNFLAFLLTLPISTDDLLDTLKRTGTTQKKLVIEHYPAMSSEALTELAREQDVSLLCHIGRHPHTPLHILSQLATSTEPSVRRAVAGSPYISISLLHQLALDENISVRRAVAHHRHTPLKDLETLAHDSEVLVRAAVALHSQLDMDLFACLVGDASSRVRAALARNVHAPQHILTALTHDHDFVVRCEVAHNPRLPKDSFLVLLHDETNVVRYNLARNAQLPQHMFQHLLNDPASSMHKYLAMNARASLSLLETLARDNNMDTWRNIARNPQASSTLLTYLAQNGNAEVKAAVASHKRTPVEVLRKLAQHQGRYTPLNDLLSNPHTPLDILEEYLSTIPLYFYFRAAHHPAVLLNRRRIIFESFLATIKNEGAPSQFRLSLLNRTNLPLPVLHAFANSMYAGERYLVALHSRTPRSLLQILTHDGNRYVRAIARAMLEKQVNQ